MSELLTKLNTSRKNIRDKKDEIAKLNHKIIKATVLDLPELERQLNKDVTDAKKDSVLAHEKVAILKAAREANQNQFGKLVEEYQAKMDSLVKVWTDYGDFDYKEAQNKKDNLTVKYAELQYMYDGNYSNYLSTLGDIMENEELDPSRSITITGIPEDLFPYFGSAINADRKEATITARGLKTLKEELEYILGNLNSYVAATGLTSFQIQEVNYRIEQNKTILDDKTAKYGEAIEKYKELRDTYLAEVTEYGFDYTGNNIDLSKHMYAKIRQEAETFYTNFKNKYDYDGTEPTTAQINSFASSLSQYLTTVVAITDKFYIDKPIEVYVGGNPKWIRFSSITSNADAKRQYLIDDFINGGLNVNNMVNNLIQSSDPYYPTTSISYPTGYGCPESECKKLYKSVFNELRNVFSALYGYDGFSISDLTEANLSVYQSVDGRPYNTDYAVMDFNLYLSNNELYYNSSLGDYVYFACVYDFPFYQYNYGGTWYKRVRNLTSGLLVEKQLAQMVVNDLNWLLNNEKTLADNKKACEDFIVAFEQKIGEVAAEAAAAEAAIAAVEAEKDAIEAAYEKYVYEHRVAVYSNGDLMYPYDMSLAEMEYKFYKDIRDTYETYLNLYNNLEDSEGTAIVVSNIDNDIKNAELNAERKDLAVDRARKVLDAWKKSGADLDNPLSLAAGLDIVMANYELELADLQAELEELQIVFDSLTKQKDAIIALMKN